MLEVVIDTNVFVSALIGGHATKEIYEGLRKDKFTIILSDSLLNELLEVLNRPEFEISQSDLKDIIAFIRVYVKIINKIDQRINVCRDPSDNMIIECALAGKAKYIVTGDKDLLTLKSFHGISILTPASFVKLLKNL